MSDDTPPTIQSYRDLRAWQHAMQLAESVYAASRRFPVEERSGLTLQLRRAAVSVPANIAEGWGRGMRKEYAHFLRIARGSLCEAETQLLLAHRFGFLDDEAIRTLLQQADGTSRLISNLIRALAR
jgi:four helix bundle protein